MRVLWLCNQMPAILARGVGRPAGNKEGWITGMAAKLSQNNEIEMGIAFPMKQTESVTGVTENIAYYSFYEDTDHPEIYDKGLEASLGLLCEEFSPDIIHIFGTEYPHTLAMLRLKEWRDHIIVHLQGLMKPCSEVYCGGLPAEVVQRSTFRDTLRQDSIWQQQEKYKMRAANEAEALKLCKHVCGRTAFDRDYILSANPKCTYYLVNETLRPIFYGNHWEREKCVSHQIFASQGNIPLKGIHYVLEALAIVKQQIPDVKIRIAGDNLTSYDTPKDRLKLSSYGKYLRQLIKDRDLWEQVDFLGSISAEKMLEEYQRAELFVISSMIENSPNSLGEAMLLGMPCIAARTGGIVSMAEEDKECLMYEPQKAEELAAKMLQLFHEPELADRLGKNAKAHAKLTHDPEANYKMLLWVYEQVKEN